MFTRVFSGGHNVLCGVMPNGDLYRFKHTDAFAWPLVLQYVGNGWNAHRAVGSTGNGEIYGVTLSGDMIYHRHGEDGVVATQQQIGWGWGTIGPFGIIAAPY